MFVILTLLSWFGSYFMRTVCIRGLVVCVMALKLDADMCMLVLEIIPALNLLMEFKNIVKTNPRGE